MGRSSGSQTVWRARSGPTEVRSGPPVTRGFEWRYGGGTQRLQVQIPAWLYQYYRSRPRGASYGVYVIDPFDRDLLGGIATRIDRFAARNGLDDVERVNFAASFVQQLEYVPDDLSTPLDHYPRYPVETLVHRGGDCADASILVAAVLRALGYDVVLLNVPKHLQVGVHVETGQPGGFYEFEGDPYYVLETTGRTWEIGDVPAEYEGEPAEAIDLRDVPVVVHRWTARTSDDRNSVRGTLHVTNLGNGTAGRVTATLRFETEAGREVGVRRHAFDRLATGVTREWLFDLNLGDVLTTSVPVGGSVNLTVGGRPHEKSESAYLHA